MARACSTEEWSTGTAGLSSPRCDQKVPGRAARRWSRTGDGQIFDDRNCQMQPSGNSDRTTHGTRPTGSSQPRPSCPFQPPNPPARGQMHISQRLLVRCSQEKQHQRNRPHSGAPKPPSRSRWLVWSCAHPPAVTTAPSRVQSFCRIPSTASLLHPPYFCHGPPSSALPSSSSSLLLHIYPSFLLLHYFVHCA